MIQVWKLRELSDTPAEEYRSSHKVEAVRVSKHGVINQNLINSKFESSFIVFSSWWRYQMETFSALLALCAGNSPVTGEFPSQRPVMWRFDIFFDLRLNRRLCTQTKSRWFETPSRSLWRHFNVESQSMMLIQISIKRSSCYNAMPASGCITRENSNQYYRWYRGENIQILLLQISITG